VFLGRGGFHPTNALCPADLVVDSDETLDFDLARRPDRFELFCRVVAADYVAAPDELAH
jgi:hypothetical protein